jgi:GT2 family glycosyltransferase
MSSNLVSVILVNWNSGARLSECLQRLDAQSYPSLEAIIVDNGSTDGSLEAAGQSEFSRALKIVRNDYNAGFSRAFNQGARLADGEFLVSLNADVWLQSDVVERLTAAFDEGERVGMTCGKLWRGAGPGEGERIIDSTGLFLNRQRRPYDRGQGEPDHGQYDSQRDVFGACGAAWMCRRAMLDDVAHDGEVLDEDFFVYYDDVDLSWRAQLRGWTCRYVPAAVAWHERGGGDTLRRASHAPKLTFAQMHAIKNRYLMMWKNDTWSSLRPALPALAAGDLARLVYVAARRPALLRAYAEAWRLRRRALAKRQVIQSRRQVDESIIQEWFR